MICCVPCIDGLPPPRIRAAQFQLVDDRVNDVVFDFLAVVRDIPRFDAIEIRAAHVQGISIERAGDVIDDAFDDHHALRPAETSECRVRNRVRLAAMGDDLDVLEVVGVVDVTKGPVVHRAGQVGGISASRSEHEPQGQDFSSCIEAHFIVGEKVVSLAGHQHVDVAVEPQLHRSLCLVRQHRGGGGNQRRLAFFAAETAAHATALHGDVVSASCERMSDDVLHFRRVLSGAVNHHAAVVLRNRHRDLTFQIEVILAADDHGAPQLTR